MKNFIYKLLYTIFPLWLVTIGWYFYYNVYLSQEMTGDLGRMAQVAFGQEYSNLVNVPSTEEIVYENTEDKDLVRQQKAVVLGVGDSFSRYGNTSYLNCLAANGMTVLSYTSDADMIVLNPFQKAWELLNLGYADSVSVKVFLVESVERELINRLSSMNINTKVVTEAGPKSDAPASANPDTGGNEWSLIYPIDYIGKMIGLRSLRVKPAQLSEPLFSHKNLAGSLYFWQGDVETEMSIDTTVVSHRRAIDNLRRLFALAQEKGVRLMVVVPPDKYDLYQSFIVDNPFPPKTINEDLRRLFPNEENLVLCKEFLLPYVQHGEKDIYMLNDTHWSPRTAKIVADELYKMLL